jgi:hypothetical protein
MCVWVCAYVSVGVCVYYLVQLTRTVHGRCDRQTDGWSLQLRTNDVRVFASLIQVTRNHAQLSKHVYIADVSTPQSLYGTVRAVGPICCSINLTPHVTAQL